MIGSSKTDMTAYGVRAFRSRHPQIKRLKGNHSPSFHGYRVWPSTWLLMDFLKGQAVSKGIRILEVGSGWGLAGIYCAKNYEASVTCVDIDSEVLPYIHLHALMNDVEIATATKGFDDITSTELKDFDILIGSDICFWDRMVSSLNQLVLRALEASVRLVLIADPGRPPFEELGRYFVKNLTGSVTRWSVSRPYGISGRILKVGSLVH
jgi:predicted nicotinamide N-methyase